MQSSESDSFGASVSLGGHDIALKVLNQAMVGALMKSLNVLEGVCLAHAESRLERERGPSGSPGGAAHAKDEMISIENAIASALMVLRAQAKPLSPRGEACLNQILRGGSTEASDQPENKKEIKNVEKNQIFRKLPVDNLMQKIADYESLSGGGAQFCGGLATVDALADDIDRQIADLPEQDRPCLSFRTMGSQSCRSRVSCPAPCQP